MPSKSRRVASRQAELSGRQRRARTRGPSGIPVQPPSGAKLQRAAEPAQEERVSATAAPPRTPPGPATHPPPQPWARPRARGVAPLPAEVYFRAQVRRIGLLAGLIFAILIALSFWLR